MQFQVPQFIEVEDKIFGPLTFKQFVYVLGGAGACYLLWRVLPIYAAVPFMIAIGGSALALAFLQYNGRPFIAAAESAFYFIIHTRLYLWSNARKKPKEEVAKAAPTRAQSLYIPKLSESKLHDLAWSLDINERIASGFATDEEREKGGGVIAPVRTARQALVK